MKKMSMLLLVALVASPLLADDNAKTKDKGDKPDASPGWLIMESDFWFPLRYEPLYSLDSIRYHYRRDQEKAAANEIDKAASWLKLAAGHAMPITEEKLTTAKTELEKLSKDLRAGRTFDAAMLDSALGKAAHALGEWHYYKAKESWAKSETQDAGHNLELAAQYLQHAADSAHYEFGPDTEKVVTTTYRSGKKTGETVHYDHNELGRHLQGVENAVKELSEAMEKK